MTRRRRPRPPLVSLRALAIVLVVALVGVTSCSDAHTQAQLDLDNHGYDPTTVVILAPVGLATTLKDLGAAYSKAHPGISVVLISDVVGGIARMVASHSHPALHVATNPRQSLSANLEPSMWIDSSSAIRGLLPPTVTVYGPEQLFGYDGVSLVVRTGNPDHVPGLSAFSGSSGFKTGLCRNHTQCGSLTYVVLRAAHIGPKPVVVTPDVGGLLTALDKGTIQAALAVSSEVADAGTGTFGLVPIRPEPEQFITYQTLRLDQSPTTAGFAKFIATSRAAARILALHGFTRTVGRGA